MNSTGIFPTEFKVLVAPKPVEEKRGSIIIPEKTRDSEKYATTEGRIVAISPLAFTYVTPEEWAGLKPKPGDAIIYAKYAGVHVKGRDGGEYVILNDKDIVATIEEAK